MAELDQEREGVGASLQRPKGLVDQGPQLCLRLLLTGVFFVEEELPDGVDSDDDEDEDDEVSWRLLTPHRKLGSDDSESLPRLEKFVQKWRLLPAALPSVL